MAKIGYRGVLCASIWQGAMIGFTAGYWAGAYTPMSNALAALGLATAAVAVHIVWRRAWRHFWPEDFPRQE